MTGVVAWFTGLPSSGKTTLATAVAGELRLRGIGAVILDSDQLRAAIKPPLGYDDESRDALYATLAELAATIARQGHVVLVPATAHRRAYRDAARTLAPAYLEIFVDTPLEERMRRDTKGLYRQGVQLAPGVGVEYEPPLAPDFHVRGEDLQGAALIAQRIDDLFD
jgi:adenylylsulfate kinase